MVSEIKLTQTVAFSPTLAADERVKRLRAEQRPVLHMGFGQAPFPAPRRLVQALVDHADEKSYLPVAGLSELRSAIANHQARLLGTEAESFDVLVAPGSKLVLYAAQMAIEGDLLLPVPSWVSYGPQAKMLGQQTIPVPIEVGDDGLVIDPEGLQQVIAEARREGLNPTKILLNYPSNPTGLTLCEPVMKAIAEVCIAENIVIIADEIYGRLAFDGGYRSISTHAPDHTIVTTGLSKHLSVGGWRLGLGTVPKAISGLFEAMVGIASETWSCVAAPVQVAAIEAYAGHADIEQFIADTTLIHKTVTRYAAERLRALALDVPMPQGGFYLWPGFEAFRGKLSDDVLQSSDALAEHLAEVHGIVTLPGSAFEAAPDVLRLRLSLCDYDGAEALALLERKGGALAADDVANFAPNVETALAGFETFLRG